MAMDVTSAIRTFCAQQREWLEQELQSEQEEAPNSGSSSSSSSSSSSKSKNGTNEQTRQSVLSNLQVAQASVGLYGRTVIRFESCAEGNDALIPAHRFTTGDEVEIRSKGAAKGSGGGSGVISQVTDDSISVALSSQQASKSKSNKDKKNKDSGNDDPDNAILGLAPPLVLIPKSSAQVHHKMMIALQKLEKLGVDHPTAGSVIRALFDPTQAVAVIPQQLRASNDQGIANATTPNLDDSQMEAIAFCLADNRPVSLIHGPPGTGKTTTVVRLIQQAVQQNKNYRVLVVAPSNVAVDNVLERLVVVPTDNNNNTRNNKHKRIRAIRLGHPARLQPSILPYSLEALVQSSDGTEIVADVRKELQGFLRVLQKPSSRGNDKRVAYQEMKVLRKEIRTREEKVVGELLQSAQVVLATCVGADNRLLRNETFDLVVIDEAAQALEAACWIPILKAKKVVLAGDHCQLPPTIKSNVPKVQKGLSQTMFERVMDLYGDSDHDPKQPGQVSRMLKVQYRMHKSIADWASQALYDGELQTHSSVQSRTISQLVGKSAAANGDDAEDADDDGVSETALLLVDTAGCSLFESTNPAGSRFNTGEAQIVARHVRTLLEIGVQQDQIAIITPYNGQVEVLRSMLLPDAPKLEIRSVDGFQGGEREAVVLSLVRSSDRGGEGIGFLKDDRRLNVAVTRAKRHCCVICDSETVSQSSFVKNLIDWIENHGTARSALEFIQESSNDQMENDLLQAEIELGLSMAGAPSKQTKKTASVKKTVPQTKSKDDPERKALLEKIAYFATTGNPGDSMALSAELTKFDRKAVHELAEKLEIGHQSEGTEGVNRRITLRLPGGAAATAVVEANPVAVAAAVPVQSSEATSEGDEIETEAAEVGMDEVAVTKSSFAALQMDEAEDSDEQDETESPAQPPTSNLLGDLAKERAARQKKAPPPAPSKSKNKKKKQAPKKLGGAKKPAPPPKDDGLDDLDDMAFLDAQVDKVQNSHGRDVKGKGSYRTVINGLLIAKPKPQEKKKDVKAASALQSKLKQSQSDRKVKKKKK